MALSNPVNLYQDIIRLKSKNLIVQRLKRERKYLENSYTTVNSLKNGFTIYRNYLRSNLPPTLKLRDKSLLEMSLDVLRLTPEQQKTFLISKNADVKKDKSNLRLIYDVDNYIHKNIQLLDSPYFINNVLGLAALTGRRVAEIACTAKFKKVDDKTAIFKGQLKTKGRTDVLPYGIPLLADFEIINESLKKIKLLKPQYINNMDLFHNACSKTLSVKVKEIYQGLFEGTPKAKDLRAIYSTICFHEYNKKLENKHIDRDIYYSQILGHSTEDIYTCGSYIDFYIL
jgi:hypothetical protein